jgi:hypothetical protein
MCSVIVMLDIGLLFCQICNFLISLLYVALCVVLLLLVYIYVCVCVYSIVIICFSLLSIMSICLTLNALSSQRNFIHVHRIRLISYQHVPCSFGVSLLEEKSLKCVSFEVFTLHYFNLFSSGICVDPLQEYH